MLFAPILAATRAQSTAESIHIVPIICQHAAAANGISKNLIRGSTVSASVAGCAVSTYLTQLYVVRLREKIMLTLLA